jgi:hypothetical protein
MVLLLLITAKKTNKKTSPGMEPEGSQPGAQSSKAIAKVWYHV